MEKNLLSDCPYQKGETTIICEAGRLIVPSVEEEKKYCESGNYKTCPHYQAAQKREMGKDIANLG